MESGQYSGIMPISMSGEGMIGLIALLGAAATSTTDKRPVCAVTRTTVFYDRLADILPEIQKDVLKRGAVAEAGRPFNRTDAIEDASLPFRRFVRAGHSGNTWFVWLEHGGLAYHYDVFGYSPLYGDRGSPKLVLSAEFSGEPCAAIKAILSGVGSSRETSMPSADSM
jgi:hypothetical protein